MPGVRTKGIRGEARVENNASHMMKMRLTLDQTRESHILTLLALLTSRLHTIADVARVIRGHFSRP